MHECIDMRGHPVVYEVSSDNMNTKDSAYCNIPACGEVADSSEGLVTLERQPLSLRFDGIFVLFPLLESKSSSYSLVDCIQPCDPREGFVADRPRVQVLLYYHMRQERAGENA